MLPRPPRLLAPLIVLAACTGPGAEGSATRSDTTGDTTGGTTGSSGHGSTDSGSAPTTGAGSGGASDSATRGEDTSTSTTGEDTTTGDTGDTSGSTGEPPPSPWDGEPLPPEPPGEWMWVDFPDSRCRDGSNTGIGVRYGTGEGLVLFFEGGGACFNLATCALNDLFANFGPIKFGAWANTIGQGGIFAEDPKNPVADWSMVYIPYCTGDVHAGDREDVAVPGVLGPQQFVGYRNVEAYLERLVPTFAEVPHVLVTGQSAGGFGAAFNYHRIRGAFPDSRVTLLDDSGPPLSDMYLAPCLQERWRELWNLDVALPPDCVDCFNPDGGGLYHLAPYLAEAHPDQRLALISSEQDSVIRTFIGYGLNDCAGGLYPADAYQEGLYVLRDEILGDDPVWASYFMPGMGHTILAGPGYATTEVAGVGLTDWLADLLAGQASHVSP